MISSIKGKLAPTTIRPLSNAIKNSSASVILGYFFHTSKAGLDYQISPKEIDRRLLQIEPSKYPLIIYEDQKPEYSPFLRAYAPEGNLDIFTRATPVFRLFQHHPGPLTGFSAGCRSLFSAAKIFSRRCLFSVPGITWTNRS